MPRVMLMWDSARPCARCYFGAVQVSFDDPSLHARNFWPLLETMNVSQSLLSQSLSLVHSAQCPFLLHPRIERHETTVRTNSPFTIRSEERRVGKECRSR